MNLYHLGPETLKWFLKSHVHFLPSRVSPLNLKLLEDLYGLRVLGDLGPIIEGNTIGHLKPLTILGCYDSMNYIWCRCPLVVGIVPVSCKNFVPAISLTTREQACILSCLTSMFFLVVGSRLDLWLQCN